MPMRLSSPTWLGYVPRLPGTWRTPRVEAVRAALISTFERFTLHHRDSEAAQTMLLDPDLYLTWSPYYLEPKIREDAIVGYYDADNEGVGAALSLPIARRMPLPMRRNTDAEALPTFDFRPLCSGQSRSLDTDVEENLRDRLMSDGLPSGPLVGQRSGCPSRPALFAAWFVRASGGRARPRGGRSHRQAIARTQASIGIHATRCASMSIRNPRRTSAPIVLFPWPQEPYKAIPSDSSLGVLRIAATTASATA
jgi:hypothetical protein